MEKTSRTGNGAVRKASTIGASSVASDTSPRWPPWKTCSRAFGMSSFISLALASGMIGSSSPDKMSVR